MFSLLIGEHFEWQRDVIETQGPYCIIRKYNHEGK